MYMCIITVERGEDYVSVLQHLGLEIRFVMWQWTDDSKTSAQFKIDTIAESDITYLTLKIKSFKCIQNV